jgi:hypothetical protein
MRPKTAGFVSPGPRGYRQHAAILALYATQRRGISMMAAGGPSILADIENRRLTDPHVLGGAAQGDGTFLVARGELPTNRTEIDFISVCCK